MTGKIACQEIWNEAVKEGEAALAKCVPTPMVVTEAGLDDRPLPGGQSWVIGDGACGFAWVVVTPGNSRFANWLKAGGLADRHYYGGVAVWIRAGDQSIQKKEAYAEAMALAMRRRGINAYAGSRLD